MFEKISEKDITMENALLFVKFNPEKALMIAEILERKGWNEKIVEVFKLAPSETLNFIYEHKGFASDLAPVIPEKIGEIINIIDLPEEQLVKLARAFPEQILRISKLNQRIIPKMFYELAHHANMNEGTSKKEFELIRKKISEVGQEFPDQILPILKQVDEFRKTASEAENIMIFTAKFFPQKAAEIATTYSLELKIAKEVPSASAQIAIEKPELAFDIIKTVPESEKEIKEYFTIKKI